MEISRAIKRMQRGNAYKIDAKRETSELAKNFCFTLCHIFRSVRLSTCLFVFTLCILGVFLTSMLSIYHRAKFSRIKIIQNAEVLSAEVSLVIDNLLIQAMQCAGNLKGIIKLGAEIPESDPNYRMLWTECCSQIVSKCLSLPFLFYLSSLVGVSSSWEWAGYCQARRTSTSPSRPFLTSGIVPNIEFPWWIRRNDINNGSVVRTLKRFVSEAGDESSPDLSNSLNDTGYGEALSSASFRKFFKEDGNWGGLSAVFNTNNKRFGLYTEYGIATGNSTSETPLEYAACSLRLDSLSSYLQHRFPTPSELVLLVVESESGDLVASSTAEIKLGDATQQLTDDGWLFIPPTTTTSSSVTVQRTSVFDIEFGRFGRLFRRFYGDGSNSNGGGGIDIAASISVPDSEAKGSGYGYGCAVDYVSDTTVSPYVATLCGYARNDVEWVIVAMWKMNSVFGSVLSSAYVSLIVCAVLVIGCTLVVVVIYFCVTHNFVSISEMRLNDVKETFSPFTEFRDVSDSLLELVSWLQQYKEFLPDQIQKVQPFACVEVLSSLSISTCSSSSSSVVLSEPKTPEPQRNVSSSTMVTDDQVSNTTNDGLLCLNSSCSAVSTNDNNNEDHYDTTPFNLFTVTEPDDISSSCPSTDSSYDSPPPDGLQRSTSTTSTITFSDFSSPTSDASSQIGTPKKWRALSPTNIPAFATGLKKRFISILTISFSMVDQVPMDTTEFIKSKVLSIVDKYKSTAILRIGSGVVQLMFGTVGKPSPYVASHAVQSSGVLKNALEIEQSRGILKFLCFSSSIVSDIAFVGNIEFGGKEFEAKAKRLCVVGNVLKFSEFLASFADVTNSNLLVCDRTYQMISREERKTFLSARKIYTHRDRAVFQIAFKGDSRSFKKWIRERFDCELINKFKSFQLGLTELESLRGVKFKAARSKLQKIKQQLEKLVITKNPAAKSEENVVIDDDITLMIVRIVDALLEIEDGEELVDLPSLSELIGWAFLNGM